MTTAVQRRRGTATEHSSFTGLEGELSVNTTNESVHVHDGSTAGGFELMRADGSNSSVTLGDISGVTAGTGLSGGGTSGTVTLDIDSTVTTLDGTQTLTNKTLTSPTLNTPTIGTSFTIGGATITEAELEILDGATVTTTELNYVDGVTSSIQTQIDAKAPLASPTFTGTVTMDGLTIESTTGNQLRIAYNSSFYWDVEREAATGDLTFTDSSDGETVRFTNDGNVGIGTSSPSDTLSVVNLGSSGTGVQISSGTSSGDLRFKARTESYNGIVSVYDSGSNEDVRISAHSGIDTYFNSGSNVGIGTSSPSSLYTGANNLVVGGGSSESGMTIYSSSTTDGNIYFADGTSGSAPYSGFLEYNHSSNFFRVGVNASERMRIDSSGNLLVGVTTTNITPGGYVFYTGSVDYQMIGHASGVGTGNYYIGFAYNGSTIGAIVQNGTTGIAYNTSSDQRLKENIADADDAGSKIDAIQVRQYDWKADGSHQDYGMIAQELVEVAPEAVTVPADSEEMMGVDYSKLVPMLIKEIQSLRNRVAQLEE